MEVEKKKTRQTDRQGKKEGSAVNFYCFLRQIAKKGGKARNLQQNLTKKLFFKVCTKTLVEG